MKTFVKWGWKTLLALVAAGALVGCASDGYVGYTGPGYNGDYGPDYYGYYPYGGYWGGDYYAYGHHRWGRYDHDFGERMSARRASAGFHGSVRGGSRGVAVSGRAHGGGHGEIRR